MIIRQVEDKYEIFDNYSGMSWGTYDTYEEAAERLRELKENIRTD